MRGPLRPSTERLRHHGPVSALVWILVAAAIAGCTAPPPVAPDPPGADPDVQPVQMDLFLKQGHRMDAKAPSKSSPDKVAANPMANGFVNEDLRAFESEPLPAALNVSHIRVVAYYEVAAPSLDPFPNASDPPRTRQIVFWAGSAGVYPASVTTEGEPLLLPGRVYKAEADLPMPKPGWIVPAGEPLQLLVATLASNDEGAELRFLVDSEQTPSRLEIEALTDPSPKPATLHRVAKEIEILGNGGMFTGATSDRVPSRVRTPIEVRANDTHLEVHVIFRSNAGGKSDLDFELYAPDGRSAAVSSTPFQSETVRLFGPNVAWFGPGTYTADVVAYSGVGTKFTLEARYDSPR